MRYVAAYMLATVGGNASPSADDLKKILGSVGIDFDSGKADNVISSLKGKTLEDLIQEGMGKLASVPSGGSVAVSAVPAAGETKKEEKKEDKKEESEEEDDDMGFGLFD